MTMKSTRQSKDISKAKSVTGKPKEVVAVARALKLDYDVCCPCCEKSFEAYEGKKEMKCPECGVQLFEHDLKEK